MPGGSQVRPLPGERAGGADEQGFQTSRRTQTRLARSAKAGRHTARHATLNRAADGSDRNKPEAMPAGSAQTGTLPEKGDMAPFLPDEPSPPHMPAQQGNARCLYTHQVRIWIFGLLRSIETAPR